MNLLQNKIIELQKKGWILLNSSESTAQLRKPKRGFSCLPNIIWSIIAVVGVILGAVGFIPGFLLLIPGVLMPLIYVIRLIFQREWIMFISVNEKGLLDFTKKRV